MTGNEMTYMELAEETERETEISGSQQVEAGKGTDENGSEVETEPDVGEKETGEAPNTDEKGAGKMSRMEAGDMLDMSKMGIGEMPNVDQARNEEINGSRQIEGREFPGSGMRNQSQETVTVYLPVGAIVHTDTAKEMTFSILEAGDELEVLFETDEDGNEVITEIWMTGTGG